MKKPKAIDEIRQMHDILRDAPQRYLQVVNESIAANPNDSQAYFDRHYAWVNLGDPRRALADINKSIELEPKPVSYTCRAQVHRQMGNHRKAIEDYRHIELEIPDLWQEDWLSLLYQADSYAHVGNLADALRCWERLPDDIWTPGPNGAPAGNKAEIQNELLRIAAEARAR
jgi:tetratricopeptide (TPR) repeat protein